MTHFIAGVTLTDVIILILLFAAFFMGYAQGLVRQLLGLGAAAIAFILAGWLREPIGGWLNQYWTTYPLAFNQMAAFLISFVVLFAAAELLMVVYYKRTPLVARAIVIDEILGGVLGVVLVLVLICMLVFILDSYYLTVPAVTNDPKWLRDLWKALDDSQIIDFLRGGLIAGIVTILGPVLPAAVRSAPA